MNRKEEKDCIYGNEDCPICPPKEKIEKETMDEFRELAREYYKLVIVEKRLLSDPAVMLNQVRHSALLTTIKIDATEAR